jgi:bifunctional UDP-N-acetylglucosamine pyrophosphorylase/glucosamine-1-phosphate N-acetyltransferase
MQDMCAIVMAAGQSTRICSELVKVLHPLNGIPMVCHVLELCRRLGVKRTLMVIGHQAERVRDALGGVPVEFVLQAEQRGTAHAVLQAEPALQGFDGDVLVLSGDVPLLSNALADRLVATHRKGRAHATLVTTRLANPLGYGRILRDRRGAFRAIVEEVEATPAQRRLKEINAGIYCFRAASLFRALHRVKPSAVRRELYLPDVLPILMKARARIATVPAEDSREALGINTRAELADAYAVLRRCVVDRLMSEGVTCLDPAASTSRPWRRRDGIPRCTPTCNWRAVPASGGCTIHAGCRIRTRAWGPGNGAGRVRDHGKPYRRQCTIGPYAHLRPQTTLKRKVKVGNFVEVKKSVIGEGQVPHLTYGGMPRWAIG